MNDLPENVDNGTLSAKAAYDGSTDFVNENTAKPATATIEATKTLTGRDLKVDETSWTTDYEENDYYFIVTCESSFSVESSKSWIDYSVSGDEIEIWVEENTGSSKRTGYLYVTCDEHGEKVSIKITQNYNDTDPLEVTIRADSTTIRQYSEFYLYAEASGGTGSYRKYQWYYAASSTGTGEATYTGDSIDFEGRLEHSPFWYYCVVTDSSGNTATSNRLKLTVTE